MVNRLEGSPISRLCYEACLTARSKGWHDEVREIGTMLALVHSEVSEALEEARKGNPEKFVEELADVCIRIFDICGYEGLNLEKAILDKMEYNLTRPYKHGGKLF